MLNFDGVTKQFPDGSYGVEDITFSLESGESLFITGHSGSGKTTLLRLLTRELIPTEGEISLNDQSLSSINRRNVHLHRRTIGMVYQDYRLIEERNVWENIALPLEVARWKAAEIEERVTELLELVELTDHALNFPRQLSGGEAQRVAIARAIANDPDIICADEPTGNLDPENSLLIADLLFELQKEGVMLLFATHDQEVLKAYSDVRRLTIQSGKITADTGTTLPKKTPDKESKNSKKEQEPQKPEPEKEKKSEKKKSDNPKPQSKSKKTAKKSKSKKKVKISKV